MKRKAIKFQPSDCTVEMNSSTFTLIFSEYRGDNLVQVRLTFEHWWVQYLARELWKVVARMRENLNTAMNAMNGTEP